MNQFKGKVAIITGANSGIGYATAKELAIQGANVIITGKRPEAIAAAANAIGARAFTADQGSLSDTDKLVTAVQEQFGKVDILFINAGITGDATLIKDATETNFDRVMDVNFKGAYFTLSKFIPLLNQGASVVFLSSNVVTMYQPQSSIYQASKAALNSIAKTAAAELAAKKIRVNLVSPGPTRTGVLDKSYGEAMAQEIWDSLPGRIPLGKIGTPEDVAKLVIYLCDEHASFITGAEFVVDGGMTL